MKLRKKMTKQLKTRKLPRMMTQKNLLTRMLLKQLTKTQNLNKLARNRTKLPRMLIRLRGQLKGMASRSVRKRKHMTSQ